ncbi:S-adenosyl-L-methionine-dependent methyltransferase [Acaromyces ingoldii]|uniref:S-adenosyl-L-methionine-dependent methyltransferase n=1 Tax=Acaromyces ingoldii TaxID=215250 RepID=A0A316YNE2_9BASI|nr:S-adenosyl-L-methionine-dependent methyltransferase [Acaromyces ingoldii]PWN90556.1 S-adenosyl-L-methionine-dependent methyltransferase [Acaromyces ingoldii]
MSVARGGGALSLPKFRHNVAKRIGRFLLVDGGVNTGISNKKATKRSKRIRSKADEEGKDLVRWMCEELKARQVAGTEKRELWSMYRRLTRGEPLAYILGNVPFGPLARLEVRPPILIPRPETEEWTERLASMLIASPAPRSEAIKILDLCTGSGCIALSLFSHLTKHRQAEVLGLDKSRIAVELARRNAHSLFPPQQSQSASKVAFEQADMFDFDPVSVGGPFDVVVCNPPYIPLDQWEKLEDGVRLWENKAALVGPGETGLGFYKRLAALVKSGGLLRAPSSEAKGKRRPAIVVEVGHDQAEKVRDIFKGTGVGLDIEIWKDAFKVQRALFMYHQ